MTEENKVSLMDKVKASTQTHPKMWIAALAISCLTLGFAGGMSIGGQASQQQQQTFQQGGNMQAPQGGMGQNGQTPQMPHDHGQNGQTPPDMQGGQDQSSDSDSTTDSSGSQTPPSQEKGKNQETKESQTTENGFATQTN